MTIEKINESLTAEAYRVFSQVDALDLSPAYSDISVAISEDAELLARIDELPRSKRQAGFLYAAARYVGAPLQSYAEFREHLLQHWDVVERLATERTMQTNDPARLLAILPILASIDGPIALVEVGTSAGLHLNLDRYSYRYDDGPWLDPDDGPSTVRLECSTRGSVPVPTRIPEIAWRAGIELSPLDLSSDADVAWLRALLWPDHPGRQGNLDAAIAIMRQHPVPIVKGDLNDRILEVVAGAPSDATLVVVHTAMLSYVRQPEAERFVETVRGLDAVWIANELADVVPGVEHTGPTRESFSFVVARDGVPVAISHPHAAWLRWLDADETSSTADGVDVAA
ncbi:DUF2332 domain-containing protein [Amnibacterium flavum]|uniref:DUF2332 domain-containing protein n=1 Tax=Amnibacterium flavum TaxID=2173173 RepID=UPI0014029590|nr:DUF2332 domain-containing protein [Amnibacterium flavum]